MSNSSHTFPSLLAVAHPTRTQLDPDVLHFVLLPISPPPLFHSAALPNISDLGNLIMKNLHVHLLKAFVKTFVLLCLYIKMGFIKVWFPKKKI